MSWATDKLHLLRRSRLQAPGLQKRTKWLKNSKGARRPKFVAVALAGQRPSPSHQTVYAPFLAQRLYYPEFGSASRQLRMLPMMVWIG
mmetsp:Transcript_45422/g.92805  ORF Transcript_45422/g.92805 Transcript_45422/m.92805 type:complete len:88 (+) Transcript_45422:3048-3311(+)